MLIAAGHRKDELPHYTRRQLVLFYREAGRLECRGRAARIEDVNIGFNGKHAAAVVKALRVGNGQ